MTLTLPNLLSPAARLGYEELRDPVFWAEFTAWIAEQPEDALVYRELLSLPQWERSVANILRTYPQMSREQAECCLNEGLCFVIGVAKSGKPLVPSTVADVGLDEGLIPFTRMFRELGSRLCGPGHFVDHEPYLPGVGEGFIDQIMLDTELLPTGFGRTIETLKSFGLRFDPASWARSAC